MKVGASNPYYLLILIVTFLVVFITMGASIHYIYNVSAEELTEAKYYFILSLLFFSLSTVGALVWATNTEIEINAVGMAMRLSGPAVLWFACLLAFKIFIVDEDTFKPRVIAYNFSKLPQDLAKYEEELGWLKYEDWKKKNPDYMAIFNEEKSLGKEFIKQLRKVASRKITKNGFAKLEDADVSTLFVYSKSQSGRVEVFKLQRITGKNNTSDRVAIPFRANSSSEENPETLAVFIEGYQQNGLNANEVIINPPKDGYVPVGAPKPDVFILAWYSDYDEYDYLFIDTRSFSDKARVGNIGIISDPAIKKNDLWMSRAKKFMAAPSEIPMSFSVLRAQDFKDNPYNKAWFADWIRLFDSEVVPELEDPVSNTNDHVDSSNKDVLVKLCEKIKEHTGDEPILDSLPTDTDSSRCSLAALLATVSSGNKRKLIRYEVQDPTNVMTLLLRFD